MTVRDKLPDLISARLWFAVLGLATVLWLGLTGKMNGAECVTVATLDIGAYLGTKGLEHYFMGKNGNGKPKPPTP